MTQMEILIDKLETANIPFETRHSWGNSIQVCYPSVDNMICDAICFHGSYGWSEGLLEIMGLTENNDDVEGWLTADEVFNRISKDYRSTN